MQYLLFVLFKAHLSILIILLILFLVEYALGFEWIIKSTIKKNKSDDDMKYKTMFLTLIYFIVNLGVYFLDAYYLSNKPDNFSFGKWLFPVILLTIIFRKLINYIQLRFN